MKSLALFTIFFLLFTSTFAFSAFRPTTPLTESNDIDNLQQIFNGLFIQGGLPAPTTVLNCYDSSSATLTVQTIGNLLQQIADKNFFGAIATMRKYHKDSDSSITTCLQHNDEFIQLIKAYNPENYTCLQLLARFGQYSLTHSQNLVNLDTIANNYFIAGDYTNAGKQIGVIGQTAIGEGSSLASFEDENEIDNLQQFYNGLFAQAGLPAPTTVLTCYNSSTAALTMNSIGNLLQQISVKNFAGAIKTMKNYYHQAPSSITDCLKNNQEFIQLVKKYDSENFTCLQILARVTSYSVIHSQELIAVDTIAYNDFAAGNYTGAGQELGVIAQKAIGEGAMIFGEVTTKEIFPAYFF